jgi:hypothetical protein
VVLGTAPLFQPPALAIGPSGELNVVTNSNPNGGDGEGEKFVWFGKSVETCSPVSESYSVVGAQPSSVTLNPAISPVDGSLAFVEAPQSSQDIGAPGAPYAPLQSWTQIAGWYATHTLWVLPHGTTTSTEISNTAGASDPVWSSRGSGLVFVKNQGLWLLANTGAEPVEVASPLASSTEPSSGKYLFGYVDWLDQFAWAG